MSTLPPYYVVVLEDGTQITVIDDRLNAKRARRISLKHGLGIKMILRGYDNSAGAFIPQMAYDADFIERPDALLDALIERGLDINEVITDLGTQFGILSVITRRITFERNYASSH